MTPSGHQILSLSLSKSRTEKGPELRQKNVYSFKTLSLYV